MIPNFIKSIFALNFPYDNIIEEQRAQRLLYITGIIFVVSILWLIFVTFPEVANNTYLFIDVAIPLAAFGISIVLYNLIQRGHVLWSSRIFVIFILFAAIPIDVSAVNTPWVANSILPIVMAGVLLDRRELMLVTGLVILNIARAVAFGVVDLFEIVSVMVSMLLAGIFLGLFNSSLEHITSLASKLVFQTRHLNEYKPDDDTTTSQQEIITNAVNLLRSQLGFSYVRVILLDEEQNPTDTYYSSIGVEQVAMTNVFSFTTNSAFQHAINDREAKIITQQDPGNLSAHLLPASSMGVIIPAQSFNEVIALFDIQTESSDPIQPETIIVLNLFLAQIAGNITYHRTVLTLREDIAEQELIINQQRQQLLNIQHRQTEGIVTDWQFYLRQRGLDSIGYDIDEKRQISDLNNGDIPDELRSAFEDGDIQVQDNGSDQLVIIPIRFRDTILGAMSFTIPKQIPITERKLEFIRSVTERLALALDNKRLLEQTQTQIERESTANEIGSILLSSTDIQTVLQTAADSFNEALGAISTQIYLQPITNEQLEDMA